MFLKKKCFYIFSVLALGLFISVYFNVKRLNEIKTVMAELEAKNAKIEMEQASFEDREKLFFNSLKSEIFQVTAYDPSPESCGKWAQFGITKTGTKPNSLRTVAVDPNIIPLGSLVYIEGIGWRIAEDTGRLVKGRTIDVYFDTYEDALEFGKKSIRVYYNQRDSVKVNS
jgi:3D (Asp-Asp-Asp) domain-containing protein